MLFWTIIFIVFYFAMLIKGNLFYEMSIKARELELEKHSDFKRLDSEINQEVMSVVWPMIFVIILAFVEIIYIYNAVFIEACKYPSIVMIFVFIISAFSAKINKFNLDTEEGRFLFKHETQKMKRYTFITTFRNLVWLCYFMYMFYALIIK